MNLRSYCGVILQKGALNKMVIQVIHRQAFQIMKEREFCGEL